MKVVTNFFSDPKMIEALVAIGTQTLAFLIFVWILKKYAWKPFLKILDDREQRIKSKFEDIQELEKKNLAIKEEYQRNLDNVEHVINQKIQEGVEEGKRLAQEIVGHARRDAEVIIQKSKVHLDLQLKKAQKDNQSLLGVTITDTTFKE